MNHLDIHTRYNSYKCTSAHKQTAISYSGGRGRKKLMFVVGAIVDLFYIIIILVFYVGKRSTRNAWQTCEKNWNSSTRLRGSSCRRISCSSSDRSLDQIKRYKRRIYRQTEKLASNSFVIQCTECRRTWDNVQAVRLPGQKRGLHRQSSFQY